MTHDMLLTLNAVLDPRQAVPAHHYWVDNLNPWIVHFHGQWGIRWYGVAYLLGLYIAWYIFARWAREGRLPLPPDEVPTLILYAAGGVFVGGRLGYCIFYNLPYCLHHPLEIFRVWHGGMASHGGIIGLTLAMILYARPRGYDAWLFLDAVAAVGPLGIFFGRIANFINGELWGRPTHVLWAVIFPRAPLVNGVNVPRHPSELYAAAIEGLMCLAVGQWMFRRQSRTGMTTAAVCIAYGIGRFTDEFWREPDVGQPVYWGWMSKGQLLTIPLFFAGLGILIYSLRKRDIQVPMAEEE